MSRTLPQIVYVEGNIGAGKTTAIQTIATCLRNRGVTVQTLLEPISRWVELDNTGQSPLGRFYENPRKYAMYFQMIVLCTLRERFDSMDPNVEIILIERSPNSSVHVFSKAMLNDNFITVSEYNALHVFANKIMQNRLFTKTIYMQCLPNVGIRRIAKRGRIAELGMSMDYMNTLHEYHNDWLNNTDVFVFNANLEKDTDEYTRECQNCADDLYVQLNYA